MYLFIYKLNIKINNNLFGEKNTHSNSSDIFYKTHKQLLL